MSSAHFTIGQVFNPLTVLVVLRQGLIPEAGLELLILLLSLPNVVTSYFEAVSW